MHGHGSVEYAGVTHRYTFTMQKDGCLKLTCPGVIRLETYLTATATLNLVQRKGEEMLLRALRRGLDDVRGQDRERVLRIREPLREIADESAVRLSFCA